MKNILFIAAMLLNSVCFAQTYCSSMTSRSPSSNFITRLRTAATSYDYYAGSYTEYNSTYSNGYQNRTNLGVISNFVPGGENFFYFFYTNPQSTYWVVVWIDFNRDGDFIDQGEEILAHSGVANETVGVGNTIIAPNTMSTGLSRMRIAHILTSTKPTPCMSNYIGEIEDYQVRVCGARTTINPSTNFNACNNRNFTITANSPGATSYYWIVDWYDSFGYPRPGGGPVYGQTLTRNTNIGGYPTKLKITASAQYSNGCPGTNSNTIDVTPVACRMGNDMEQELQPVISESYIEIPNRFNDAIHVNVYSMDGTLVSKQNTTEGDIQISTDQFKSGLYMLDINRNGTVTKNKILITK